MSPRRQKTINVLLKLGLDTDFLYISPAGKGNTNKHLREMVAHSRRDVHASQVLFGGNNRPYESVLASSPHTILESFCPVCFNNKGQQGSAEAQGLNCRVQEQEKLIFLARVDWDSKPEP